MPRKDFENATKELAELELELMALLRIELSKIVNGYATLFFFSNEFNPHNFPSHYLSSASNESIGLARKTIELRKILVLPTEGCIGRLLINAFKESADLHNAHRRGPRRLAADLLSQLNGLKGEATTNS